MKGEIHEERRAHYTHPTNFILCSGDGYTTQYFSAERVQVEDRNPSCLQTKRKFLMLSEIKTHVKHKIADNLRKWPC